MTIGCCLPLRRKKKKKKNKYMSSSTKGLDRLNLSDSPSKGEQTGVSVLPTSDRDVKRESVASTGVPQDSLQPSMVGGREAELDVRPPACRGLKGALRRLTMCLVSVALWKAASAKSMASLTLAAVSTARTSPSSNEIRELLPAPPQLVTVRADDDASTASSTTTPPASSTTIPSHALTTAVSMPSLTRAASDGILPPTSGGIPLMRKVRTFNNAVSSSSIPVSPPLRRSSLLFNCHSFTEQAPQEFPPQTSKVRFLLVLLAAELGLSAGHLQAIILTTCLLYLIPRLALASSSDTQDGDTPRPPGETSTQLE